MRDEFQTFVELPTAENYLMARDAIVGDAGRCTRTADLVELAELYGQGDFEAAREKIQQMMPAWALSPRVHFFAAQAAEQLGDDEDGELEQFLFSTCLQGLLATGDGSAARPYQVAQTADEYDVLQALGLLAQGQVLVERGAGLYDVVTCDDGSRVWFEVTDLVRTEEPATVEVGRIFNPSLLGTD
jgi:hypothetical protein